MLLLSLYTVKIYAHIIIFNETFFYRALFYFHNIKFLLFYHIKVLINNKKCSIINNKYNNIINNSIINTIYNHFEGKIFTIIIISNV